MDSLQRRIGEQSDSAGNDEELLKMKRAVDELQKELTKIDIRNGVLSNFIMNRQFIEKKTKLENVLEGLDNPSRNFALEDSQLEELI